jgi:hypothetical protein
MGDIFPTAVASVRLFLAGVQAAFRLDRVLALCLHHADIAVGLSPLDPSVLQQRMHGRFFQSPTGLTVPLRILNLQNKILGCFVVNGAIFLGCMKWLEWVVRPSVLILTAGVLPPHAAATAARGFDFAYSALWLFPAYFVSLFVSYTWYSQIAEETALHIQRQAQQKIANADGVVMPAATKLVHYQHRGPLERIAQEVYRNWFFCVALLCNMAMARLPILGAL